MRVDVIQVLPLFRSSDAAEELSIRQIEELCIAKPHRRQSQFTSVLRKPFLVCGEDGSQTFSICNIAVECQFPVIFDASLRIDVAVVLSNEAIDSFGDVSRMRFRRLLKALKVKLMIIEMGFKLICGFYNFFYFFFKINQN